MEIFQKPLGGPSKLPRDSYFSM